MPERRTTQHDATGPVGRYPVLPLRSLALRHETTPRSAPIGRHAMTRAKNTPDQPEPATDTAPALAPDQEPTVQADDTRFLEPYPGAEFFHGGRYSPIITAMGHRLEQEGCSDGRYLGPDWTTAHRDAVAAWQKQLRPKAAGDVSGIPDETAWDRLRVPRVSPLPKES